MNDDLKRDLLADLPLSLLLKHLRANSWRGPLGQDVLGKFLGKTSAYISQIENEKGYPNVSEIQDLSIFFGQDRSTQRLIHRLLLKATIVFRMPEAEDLVNAQGEVLPHQALERIKKDLEGHDLARQARMLDLTEDAFLDILEGLRPISRKQIYMLAKEINQNPVEFLLLSSRMPYETLDVLINSPDLFQTLVRASQESTRGKAIEEETLR